MSHTAATSATLGREEYKTLSLSALGGTLEFYDFVIFVFFSATLGHLFFPSTLPAIWRAPSAASLSPTSATSWAASGCSRSRSS